MTNEEAIKQLKKCKSFHNGSYGTALDLAIKALEATEQVHTSHSGVQMFPKGVFEAIYKDNEESEGAE